MEWQFQTMDRTEVFAEGLRDNMDLIGSLFKDESITITSRVNVRGIGPDCREYYFYPCSFVYLGVDRAGYIRTSDVPDHIKGLITARSL